MNACTIVTRENQNKLNATLLYQMINKLSRDFDNGMMVYEGTEAYPIHHGFGTIWLEDLRTNLKEGTVSVLDYEAQATFRDFMGTTLPLDLPMEERIQIVKTARKFQQLRESQVRHPNVEDLAYEDLYKDAETALAFYEAARKVLPTLVAPCNLLGKTDVEAYDILSA